MGEDSARVFAAIEDAGVRDDDRLRDNCVTNGE